MRLFICIAGLAFAGLAAAQHHSSHPYAGQQERSIKSLSADEETKFNTLFADLTGTA